MIKVRCPFTHKIFQYDTEEDIPEGLIFERVVEYKMTREGVESTVFCSGPKEALSIAIGSGKCHMRLAPA